MIPLAAYPVVDAFGACSEIAIGRMLEPLGAEVAPVPACAADIDTGIGWKTAGVTEASNEVRAVTGAVLFWANELATVATAGIAAVTKAVVAKAVVLLPGLCVVAIVPVGKVGVPVKVGEATVA